MYVKDGIVYAGERPRLPSVVGVRALPGHRLWVRFRDGQTRVFDLTPYLHLPIFAPLQDEAVFARVYIDHGAPTWLDGDADIDPEMILEKGVGEEDGNNRRI